MSYQNIVKGVCLMDGRFYDFQRLDTCKLLSCNRMTKI